MSTETIQINLKITNTKGESFKIKNLSTENTNLLNCLGKVEFWINGKKSFGSGSLIQTRNFPIVATAAHCIYDWESKYFYESLSFLPFSTSFKTKLRPYAAVIPKIWSEKAIVDFDTGFLLFNSFSNIENYTKYTIPAVFNIPRELNYIVAGFQNRIFPSKKPTANFGKANQDFHRNSTLQSVKSKGKNGMSGGPWLTKHKGVYIQNSVSSLSFKSQKNLLWGPYWGETIEATFKVAEDFDLKDPRVISHIYMY